MFLELAQWMFEAVKDVISASRRHYLWRQCFQPVFWQFNDKPEGVGGCADQKNTEPKNLAATFTAHRLHPLKTAGKIQRNFSAGA